MLLLYLLFLCGGYLHVKRESGEPTCIRCPNEENPKQIVDKVEYKTHSIQFFFIVSTFFFFFLGGGGSTKICCFHTSKKKEKKDQVCSRGRGGEETTLFNAQYPIYK